jgi:hypothetical protein
MHSEYIRKRNPNSEGNAWMAILNHLVVTSLYNTICTHRILFFAEKDQVAMDQSHAHHPQHANLPTTRPTLQITKRKL